MTKTLLRASIRCLTGLLLLGLLSCAQSPPEQRLRERIAGMQSALESGQPREFMDGVAENFIGNGGMDRRQLRAYLAATLLRQGKAGVSVVSMQVTLRADEQQAEVELNVLLTGGRGLLPDQASTYTIRSAWNDGDDGWQVISADWERGL